MPITIGDKIKSNIHITDIQVGYYQHNAFIGESLGTSSTINAESGCLYRVTFDSFASTLGSNAWDNIGGNEG